MKQLTLNQQIVADDILRYKRNKLAQVFAILGIVFNCLYFCLLYAIPDNTMRKFTLGVSVILTLVLLLLVFLSSEGVKGYNKKFSIVLWVIAAFQIARIFYYPLKGLTLDSLKGIGYFGIYPTNSTLFFTIMLIWLCASAACLITAGVLGWVYAVRLQNFQKQLEAGEISLEQTFKEMDAEDEAKAMEEAMQAAAEAESDNMNMSQMVAVAEKKAKRTAKSVKKETDKQSGSGVESDA